MRKNKGFTLLEVIVFIILIGIIAAAIPTVISLPQVNGVTAADPYEYDQAMNLAKSHMEIMIGQRAKYGFFLPEDILQLDPCNSDPNARSGCPANPANYAINITTSSPPNCIDGSTDFVCYTIKVNGGDNNSTAAALLHGLEAQYQ